MDKQLQNLAKGRRGVEIIEVLKGVQNKVADIRNKLDARPEVDAEVRIAVINAIEIFLIQKLRAYQNNEGIESQDPNEHL